VNVTTSARIVTEGQPEEIDSDREVDDVKQHAGADGVKGDASSSNGQNTVEKQEDKRFSIPAGLAVCVISCSYVWIIGTHAWPMLPCYICVCCRST